MLDSAAEAAVPQMSYKCPRMAYPSATVLTPVRCSSYQTPRRRLARLILLLDVRGGLPRRWGWLTSAANSSQMTCSTAWHLPPGSSPPGNPGTDRPRLDDLRYVGGCGAGEARTHDRRIMRSTAPCTVCASCTDKTDHRAHGTRRAGIIWCAGPRTGPRVLAGNTA